MEDATVCGYKLLRELGARRLPSYAALDPKPRRPEDALCVVERFGRDAGADAAAVFLRDAKRLSQLKHPNLVRVRDVILDPSVVLLVSDWIDGELLLDVQRIAAEQSVPIPLAGSLRIIVDLLEGLSALHELCDAKRERLQIVHAEVAPRNVAIGLEGQAVVIHPLRPAATLSDGHPQHAPDVVGYLAPEVLLGDQTADQRADVYGAGVLLWEALAGRRMHPDGEDAGEIVMRLLGGKVIAPGAPADAPWAAPLEEIAKRAVAPDPSMRFANATAMLAEVRRVAGARLAPKLTVSALVEAVAGERIRARAEGLGAKRTRARLPSESAWTTEAEASATTPRVPEADLVDAEATRRPTPVPPLAASARPPKPPPPAPRAAVPPATSVRATPPLAMPLRMAPFTRATPSRGIAAVVSSPGPVLATLPATPAAPAVEPESLAIDILEAEVESNDPPPPPAPHSPPPPGPFRTEMSESKTDMAAAVAPLAAVPATAKARWSIAVACALGLAGVLWLLLRPSTDAPPGSNEAPAPSVAGSAGPPARSSLPLPEIAPPSLAADAPEPSTHDPSVDVHHPPRASTPVPPPVPSISDAARQGSPMSDAARQGSPIGEAARQGSPMAPQPGPSASSTHAKKRVYDPMGI